MFLPYLFCFCCYILFSRQPDFFDGEKGPATIVMHNDGTTGKIIPMAVYSDGHRQHSTDARYLFRKWVQGEKLEVIYESGTPERSAVYAIWGYWITWKEILYSIIGWYVLFLVAVAITRHPAPEAIIDQLNHSEEKKRKYL